MTRAASFPIRAAGATDPGRRRPRNEDAFTVVEHVGLYAVADGVSTRPRGEEASARALELVERFLGADRTWPVEDEDLRASFSTAVARANGVLHREAQDWPKGLGPTTTFAGILVDGDRACVCHVGDSRIYRLRGGVLEALTEDHNYANELARRGTPREEAHAMENAKVLSRALGLAKDVKVTARVEVLRAGDVFLACSDGLHGVVPEAEVAGVLAEVADAAAAATRLIERACELGGPDNVTVVVVRVEPPDP